MYDDEIGLEEMLGAELKVHLNAESEPGVSPEPAEAPPARRGSGNRRNGTTPKSVQGDKGKISLDVPRDRDGTFEPQLVPKHQRRLSGFDEKILALYAKGMTTHDIQQIIKGLDGVEVLPSLVS